MVLPGIGSHSPFFQSLTSKGCASLAGGVVLDRRQHQVAFSTPRCPARSPRTLWRCPCRSPSRCAPSQTGSTAVDQRMDEGMHVGGVEIVLLVPGRRRQHDVGIEAGRRHAEIERDQQVELSFRRLVVPGDLARLSLAVLAEVLALHAVLGAEQVLEEIFVALAATSRADSSARRTDCAASWPDCPGRRRQSCSSPDFSALAT